MNEDIFHHICGFVSKYKYVVAVALLGVILMLLPTRQEQAEEDEWSRTAVQAEMEGVLSAFDGVGALKLMLTMGPETERWTGAVVVCEGGENATVRLQLTQALCALTGLSSDKIAIVKGTP